MNSQAHADARLTADRSELKFLVPLVQARSIARVLSERLEPHRFTGPGANRLPGARHFVTTVYFDTVNYELFTDAQANHGSLKVRAKAYYDRHVALTEMARNRSALLRPAPVLWVELKETSGARSGKRRVGIPKHDLPSFFSKGVISKETLEIQREEYGNEANAVIDALLEVCQRFSTTLRPSALVNYRRSAWQGEGQTVRVTIDRDLAFFAPPADLWDRSLSLERGSLGPKIREETHCVLEVKSIGPLPAWLQELLGAHAGPPKRFSKFVAAFEAVQDSGTS